MNRTGRAVSHDRLVPWLVGALAGAVWTALAISQWRALVFPSWDLAIFTQAVQAYAHGLPPIADVKGVGTHLLGDHFHPILILLTPIQRLFPSALTLLIVQAALFGLSAVPLTAAARARLGPRLGTVVGVANALSWGLASAAAAQFHEIAFAVPLLALSLAAFLRDRPRACVLWAAGLVLVKEDLGLTVAALGVVLTLRGHRRWGAAAMVWGVVWFALTVAVLLPAFNADDQWDYVARLTGSVAGSPATVAAADPGGLLHGPWQHLTSEPLTKLTTVGLLVLAAGVLGVRSPLMLVMLPTLAWRFLGEVPAYWGSTWHYSAVLMPVATAALVDAVAGRPAGKRQAGQGQAGNGQAQNGQDAASRHHVRIAAALALATTAATLATGPVTRLASPQAFAPSARTASAHAVVEAVEPGARIASDVPLMALLVPRARVQWTGHAATDPAPRYVLRDRWARGWGAQPPRDLARWAAEQWPGTSWQVVLDRQGYVLVEQR